MKPWCKFCGVYGHTEDECDLKKQADREMKQERLRRAKESKKEMNEIQIAAFAILIKAVVRMDERAINRGDGYIIFSEDKEILQNALADLEKGEDPIRPQCKSNESYGY